MSEETSSLILRDLYQDLDENENKDSPFCGTVDGVHIWCNSTDISGFIFTSIVWMIYLYICIVLIVLFRFQYLNYVNGILIFLLLFLSIWSHTKTMLTDPGAVPRTAFPLSNNDLTVQICGRCECYKPPKSHHGITITISITQLIK
jgi:hypothetical protein